MFNTTCHFGKKAFLNAVVDVLVLEHEIHEAGGQDRKEQLSVRVRERNVAEEVGLAEVITFGK